MFQAFTADRGVEQAFPRDQGNAPVLFRRETGETRAEIRRPAVGATAAAADAMVLWGLVPSSEKQLIFSLVKGMKEMSSTTSASAVDARRGHAVHGTRDGDR
jgi:hypothetical protein